MHLAVGTVTEIQNAKVLFTIAVLVVAAFLRPIVRTLLTLVAAAALAALGFGLVMLVETIR
jgi:hypothetical protein